jgi:DNA-directed RNA polymerase subunit RPC12/RpoP
MEATTTTIYRVTVGHGHDVHATESLDWNTSRTLCGRLWTDEGTDEMDISCRQCRGRLTGKGRAPRVIEQPTASDFLA